VQANVEGDAFLPDLAAGEWREISRQEYAADELNDFDVTVTTLER
jgi:dihydrofolate reductase